MSTRRITASKPGSPQLEAVRHDLYDTSECREGCCELEFFKDPAMGHLYSNMPASAQLPYPQQFHAYGIGFESYLESAPEKVAALGKRWPIMEKAIFSNAYLEFWMGLKEYAKVPVSALLGFRHMKPLLMRIKDTWYRKRRTATKYVLEKYMEGEEKPIERWVYPRTKEGLKRLQGTRRGNQSIDASQPEDRIVKVKRQRYRLTIGRPKNYYDMTVYFNGKYRPLHIPPHCVFYARIRWTTMAYFPSNLRDYTVLVRLSLVGVLYREVC